MHYTMGVLPDILARDNQLHHPSTCSICKGTKTGTSASSLTESFRSEGKCEDKKARETGLEKTLTPTLMDGLFTNCKRACPCGLMDKALPSGGRDCGFESRLGLVLHSDKTNRTFITRRLYSIRQARNLRLGKKPTHCPSTDSTLSNRNPPCGVLRSCCISKKALEVCHLREPRISATSAISSWSC